MRRRLIALGTVLALAVSVSASIARAQTAEDPVLKRIWTLGMDSSRVYDLAQVLLDSLGPRLTGTAGLDRAQNWLIKTYASWGISARNEQWGTWRGWKRGILHVDLLQPRERTLDANLMGRSPGTGGKNIVGPVIVLPALRDSFAFAKWLPQSKGKFVLISPADPTCRTTDDWAKGASPAGVARMDSTRAKVESDWGARLDAIAMPRRVEPLAVRLDDAGALGVIYSQHPRTVWGAYSIFDVYLPRTHRGLVLAVSCEDNGLLSRLAERGQGPVIRVNSDATVLDDVPVYNTIGKIDGSTKPNEYVALGAHFDSYDIASGAKDNGAGSLVMMEAMRILAAAYPHPKRTILATHWSGEEVGLIGSASWAADHPDVLRNIMAYFEQDFGTWRADSLSGGGLPDGGQHLKRWFAALPLEMQSRLRYAGVGERYVSELSCHNLPAFGFRAVWQDDLSHSNLDTFDKLVFDDLRERATTVAMLAYLASEDPSFVKRDAMTGQAPGCRFPQRNFRVADEHHDQPPFVGPTTTFVVRKGNDTVSVERFARTAGTLRSEVRVKAIGTFSISATLRPNQTLAHIDAHSDSRAIDLAIDFPNASATVATSADVPPMSQAFLVNAISLTEQTIRSIHLALGDSAKISVVRLSARDVVAATVTRIHADSVTVRVPPIGVYRFAISSTGDILGGLFPAQGWTIERAK
jgi:hypothetical protein